MTDEEQIRGEGKFIDDHIITYHQPISLFSQEYNNIYSTLQSIDPENIPRLFSITSAKRREGRTTATLNLAVVISRQIIGKILVVDADFQQPSVHRYMDLPVEKGFVDILENKADLKETIKKTSVPNLHIMSAGQYKGGNRMLFASPIMSGLMRKLREEYEFVIFDVPPINDHPETGVLATFLDGVLFLLKAEHTSKQAIEMARVQLSYFNVKIMGCFLTSVEEHIPKFIFQRFFS